MDIKTYERITRVYKVISNKWSYPDYRDGYTIFDRKKWEKNESMFDFLNQFLGVQFSVYFKESHIKSFSYPERYFASDTIIITDNQVKVHYDFSLVLYSYIAHVLRPELQQFYDLILSGTLQNKYGKSIITDEYSVQYRAGYHEEIYKHILTEIPQYGLVWNLLSIGSIITIEEYTVKIRYARIENILKGLDVQYDFSQIQIV